MLNASLASASSRQPTKSSLNCSSRPRRCSSIATRMESSLLILQAYCTHLPPRSCTRRQRLRYHQDAPTTAPRGHESSTGRVTRSRVLRRSTPLRQQSVTIAVRLMTVRKTVQAHLTRTQSRMRGRVTRRRKRRCPWIRMTHGQRSLIGKAGLSRPHQRLDSAHLIHSSPQTIA